MKDLIKSKIESAKFEKFITIIIVINSITLGLETNKDFSPFILTGLGVLDKCFLAIFVAEILLKIFVYQRAFLKDPWRIFDFSIVFISVLPASGPFSVLRSLRILRTLRMLSVVPSLKKVIGGLIIAIPSLGAVVAIISLLFYISAVMATKLFGDSFPLWFGSIWHSLYSLFQIMTLESWSMGIVRPVMERYPYAWLFFLPFILITTFTMLNLFMAVIVNGMQAETDSNAQKRAEKGHDEREKIFEEIELIKEKLDKLLDK